MGKNMRRQRRLPSLMAAALLTGVLLGGGITSASAVGTADSSTAQFSVNGITYYDFARVTANSNGTVYASTWIRGASTVPAGWAGVNGRLFRSSGAMVGESGFYYNGSSMPAGNQLVNTTGHNARGTFYSYGVARGWNGSSYNSYYTFQSPYQNN